MTGATLGPERIEGLLRQVVRGLNTNDRGMATGALMELYEQGTPVDVAAFVVGAYSMVRQSLPWATVASVSKHDSVLAASLHTAMLESYLAGDRDLLLELFFSAPGAVASEALGIAARVAADTVRSFTARMS